LQFTYVINDSLSSSTYLDNLPSPEPDESSPRAYKIFL